jgi:hypothetical protein
MRGLSLISILNLHDRAKLEIKKEKTSGIAMEQYKCAME